MVEKHEPFFSLLTMILMESEESPIAESCLICQERTLGKCFQLPLTLAHAVQLGSVLYSILSHCIMGVHQPLSQIKAPLGKVRVPCNWHVLSPGNEHWP